MGGSRTQNTELKQWIRRLKDATRNGRADLQFRALYAIEEGDFYDGEAFVGLDFDALVPTGLRDALRRGARGGDAEWQFMLGYCYLKLDVGRTYRWAFHWLRKAAEQGHLKALYHLGFWLYVNGDSKADFVEGVEWLRQAAEAGHPKACIDWARELRLGETVRKDRRRAFRVLKGAADTGDLEAVLALGVYYHEGVGVRRDDKKSVACYRRAARASEWDTAPCACYNLGLSYYYGDGVPENDSLARKWMLRAHELEHFKAAGFLRERFGMEVEDVF